MKQNRKKSIIIIIFIVTDKTLHSFILYVFSEHGNHVPPRKCRKTTTNKQIQKNSNQNSYFSKIFLKLISN